MDTQKASQQQNRGETLMSNQQDDLTMGMIVDDHTHPPVQRLSPSEALTRFVPDGWGEELNIRSIAPMRFGTQVGDIGLLVPIGMHSEVVEQPKIYPLPTAPKWFQGLINLRGNLVPVFNLKSLLQIGDEGTENPYLLVLNNGDEAVGYLIDGLPVTLDVDQKLEQCPLLPSLLREHGHAVYMQDGRVWVEFDFDGFFRALSSLSIA